MSRTGTPRFIGHFACFDPDAAGITAAITRLVQKKKAEKLKGPYRTHVEVGDLIEAVLGPGVEVMEPRVGRGVLS